MVFNIDVQKDIPVVKRKSFGFVGEIKEELEKKNLQVTDSFQFIGTRSQVDTIRKVFSELGWSARVVVEKEEEGSKNIQFRIWRMK